MEITYKFSINTHTHTPTRIVELEQTKINNIKKDTSTHKYIYNT